MNTIDFETPTQHKLSHEVKLFQNGLGSNILLRFYLSSCFPPKKKVNITNIAPACLGGTRLSTPPFQPQLLVGTIHRATLAAAHTTAIQQVLHLGSNSMGANRALERSDFEATQKKDDDRGLINFSCIHRLFFGLFLFHEIIATNRRNNLYHFR